MSEEKVPFSPDELLNGAISAEFLEALASGVHRTSGEIFVQAQAPVHPDVRARVYEDWDGFVASPESLVQKPEIEGVQVEVGVFVNNDRLDEACRLADTPSGNTPTLDRSYTDPRGKLRVLIDPTKEFADGTHDRTCGALISHPDYGEGKPPRYGYLSTTINSERDTTKWHIHPDQVDDIIVCSGHVVIALCDMRPKSSRRLLLLEVDAHASQQVAVRVPSGVAHSFAAIGKEPANLLFLSDRVYGQLPEGVSEDDPVIRRLRERGELDTAIQAFREGRMETSEVIATSGPRRLIATTRFSWPIFLLQRARRDQLLADPAATWSPNVLAVGLTGTSGSLIKERLANQVGPDGKPLQIELAQRKKPADHRSNELAFPFDQSRATVQEWEVWLRTANPETVLLWAA